MCQGPSSLPPGPQSDMSARTLGRKEVRPGWSLQRGGAFGGHEKPAAEESPLCNGLNSQGCCRVRTALSLKSPEKRAMCMVSSLPVSDCGWDGRGENTWEYQGVVKGRSPRDVISGREHFPFFTTGDCVNQLRLSEKGEPQQRRSLCGVLALTTRRFERTW